MDNFFHHRGTEDTEDNKKNTSFSMSSVPLW